ncbi:MAG: ATP-binding cassette domain-containing protein [Treponema sp.]|jgi:simple sugar transport system ATP-binding protein|nr:ATP-binding cassette domain-containing protein [Treponema sp.]
MTTVYLHGILKQFSDGFIALDTVDFTIKPGVIHALLGENGAGKSTLMHIAAGYLLPTAGTILLNGKEQHFSTPSQALKCGIAMLRQHPSVTPGLSVWEDCILGAEGGVWFNRRRLKKKVFECAEQWNIQLPLNRQTTVLSPGERQKAALLALLLRKVEVFIFDEPTAVLNEEETESLYAMFRSLAAAGHSIVHISHKLEETLSLAAYITVLRGGKTVASAPASTYTVQSLKHYLFGEASSLPQFKDGAGVTKECILRLDKLSVERPGFARIHDVTCDVRAGTIVGITGGRESGLETLERTVTGLLKASRGTVTINGIEVSGIHTFRRAGASYLPADGSAYSLGLSLRDNLLINNHRHIPFLKRKPIANYIHNILTDAGVNVPESARFDSCSGGMIQRILLSRVCAEQSRLLVLSEPGWGLDQKSLEALNERLRRYVADSNHAVLLFASDRDTVLFLADEVFELSDKGLNHERSAQCLKR